MGQINGTPVNFGITGTAVTGIAGIFQSLHHSLQSAIKAVLDESGETVTEVFHDKRAESEIVFKVTGADVATAKVNTTIELFPPGTFVTITAAPHAPDLVHSNWAVTEAGPKINSRNDDVAEISIPLRRRDGIVPPSVAA